MPNRAARTHSAYRSPPSGGADQVQFRKDCYAHMEKIANMAILAKKANKTEDAERHDMELMVLKSALASIQPVRDQKREVNWKLDKARDRLTSTQSRIKDLSTQEREIEVEIAQLESCKNELEELQEEPEDVGHGGPCAAACAGQHGGWQEAPLQQPQPRGARARTRN